MSNVRAVHLFVLVYCEQRSSIIRYFEFVEIASHVDVDRVHGMRDFIRGIELREISAARFQILSTTYHVVRAIGMWSPTRSRPEGQEIFSLVPLYLQVHCLPELSLRPHQIAPRVKNYRSWIGDIDASRAHQNETAIFVASRIPLRNLCPRRWLAKSYKVLRWVNPIKAQIVRVQG